MALGGDKLSDFEEFKESPLVLDLIASWETDCTNRPERVELLEHPLGLYMPEDFDEPDHFDEEGNAILPYGDPGDVHFDKDGKPIDPYVLAARKSEKA